MASGRADRSVELQAPPVRPFALALVLLLGCGGRGLPDWKTSPTPGPNAKRVDHLEQVTGPLAWRRSPYFRINDRFDLPVYLIVAADGTACIAPADDWTIADHGDFYPCPREWRIARESP
jgi:hypothetical protein